MTPFPTEEFVKRFDGLRLSWGYGADATGTYESKMCSYRAFQPLTTCLMRFLLRKRMFYSDAKTMYDVDFYGMKDEDLLAYLEGCGEYFLKNQNLLDDAFKYLHSCPVSRESCLLRVCMRWLEIVRSAVCSQTTIKEFRQSIHAAAIDECRDYMLKYASVSLNVGIDVNEKNAKEALSFVNDYFDT